MYKCEQCKADTTYSPMFSMGENKPLICAKCINVELLKKNLESKPDFKGDSTPIGIREIPNYYKGEILGIRAKDVISDFNLSYNVGTAVTYLLRAGNKPDNSYEQDLEKSLHHIVFELERIKNKEKK